MAKEKVEQYVRGKESVPHVSIVKATGLTDIAISILMGQSGYHPEGRAQHKKYVR